LDEEAEGEKINLEDASENPAWKFAFKCNVYRYDEEKKLLGILDEPEMPSEVGLCTLNQVDP
jgi:hypothetical protein